MGIATSSNELDLKVLMGCQVGCVSKKEFKIIGLSPTPTFLLVYTTYVGIACMKSNMVIIIQ